MKKITLFVLTILVATSSATAPSIPELRMTPTDITTGDKGESQIGSSKLAGVHTKVLGGLLFHFAIRSSTHDYSGSFSS